MADSGSPAQLTITSQLAEYQPGVTFHLLGGHSSHPVSATQIVASFSILRLEYWSLVTVQSCKIGVLVTCHSLEL